MMDYLFADLDNSAGQREALTEGAILLRGYARDSATALLEAVRRIALQSPFRQMETPGGYPMSVAMTNCGLFGWTTDRCGYRYSRIDPLRGDPWPAMPDDLHDFARQAAAEAGFPAFSPDTCLINRYAPGTKLSLHQDKDEIDFQAPIVSVSLGHHSGASLPIAKGKPAHATRRFPMWALSVKFA